MKPVTTCLISTLFAFISHPVTASLEARQVATAKYILTGDSSTPGTPYPSYNISVPENGITHPITNPLTVYSISPASIFEGSFTPTSNCTFTLEDGTLAYVDSTYDIIPQKVVSVSCVPIPSAPSSSSTYFPTATSNAIFVYPATKASLVVSSSSILPLFYNGTGSRPSVGGTGAHGSAVPSATTGAGLTPGGGGVLAFKGGAGRVVVGLQGLIVTMIGVGLVL